MLVRDLIALLANLDADAPVIFAVDDGFDLSYAHVAVHVDDDGEVVISADRD